MSYVLPLGPYHPSLEEPVHVKLYTEGELIKKSEVFIGYNHRKTNRGKELYSDNNISGKSMWNLLPFTCHDILLGNRRYSRYGSA